MSAIRVVRVIARMNVGGPALQVTALTDGLDPQRFEQRLLVGDVDEGEADYLALRAPHVVAERVHGLGRTPSPVGDLRALATIRRVIREFRPHIVHTHTAKAGVLGRTAAMLAHSRTRVHTFHGHLLHGYFSPLVTRGVVAVERAVRVAHDPARGRRRARARRAPRRRASAGRTSTSWCHPGSNCHRLPPAPRLVPASMCRRTRRSSRSWRASRP